MNTILLFAFFVLTPSAQAFIPNTDFIVERAVKNAGKGAFVVENEVVFRNETETLTVKERWTIQDADNMALEASGPGFKVFYLYLNGKVTTMETPGEISSRRAPPEHLERFFHAKGERTLANLLLQAKVISLDPLRPRHKPKSIKDIKAESDPFVRLSRLESGPALLISHSNKLDEVGSAPGVWFDQSTYLISKIRFPQGHELIASLPWPLSQDLVLPRIRMISWNNQGAEIRLLKAQSLAKGEVPLKELQPKTPNIWTSGPLGSQVRDFYSRFR